MFGPHMPAGIDDLATLALQPVPGSVAEARRFAGAAMRRWHLTDLSADIELVLSELVTNAVLHARTAVEVTIMRIPGGVRIEVADGSAAGPVPHVLAPPVAPATLLTDDADLELVEELLNSESTTGRGLQLVESLSIAWGRSARPHAPGKIVWAIFGHPSGPVVEQGSIEVAAAADERPLVGHPVRVMAVPVWLALASGVNLDAVIRELQMVEAAGAPPDYPTAQVAMARAFLEDFAGPRRSVQLALRSALERGNRRFDVDLLVPDGAVASMRRMGRVLDDLSAYCERGELLALAPSAKVRRFRRWYFDEVAGQMAGRAPRTCPFTTATSRGRLTRDGFTPPGGAPAT